MILRLRRGKRIHVVEVAEGQTGPEVRIDAKLFEADIVRLGDGSYSVLSQGRSIDVAVAPAADGWSAHSGGRTYRLRADDAAAAGSVLRAGAGSPREVRATLPGKIIQVQVQEGSRVREGDSLVVIEAMKMENELRAPFDARVASVAVGAGQAVETGALLLVLEPLGEAREEPED